MGKVLARVYLVVLESSVNGTAALCFGHDSFLFTFIIFLNGLVNSHPSGFILVK